MMDLDSQETVSLSLEKLSTQESGKKRALETSKTATDSYQKRRKMSQVPKALTLHYSD
jgi:hypothetical protein